MSIIRVEKTGNYSVISNEFLNDKRISFKEKGLLSYLLTKPDNWQINVSHLVKVSDFDGRDAIYKMLNNLIKIGYVSKKLRQGKGGKLSGYDYTIHEKPFTEKPETVDPVTGNPDTVKPDTEKPDINKYSEEIKTEDKISQGKPAGFKLSGKKKKPETESEPFWKELVEVWFTINVEMFKKDPCPGYPEGCDGKPSFKGRDPVLFKNIISELRKKYKEEKWTLIGAPLRLKLFFDKAAQHKWIKDKFTLKNIWEYFDEIWLDQAATNGKTNSNNYESATARSVASLLSGLSE